MKRNRASEWATGETTWPFRVKIEAAACSPARAGWRMGSPARWATAHFMPNAARSVACPTGHDAAPVINSPHNRQKQCRDAASSKQASKSKPVWIARRRYRTTHNREALMNRKTAGALISLGIAIAAFAGSASAQNSPGSAALDASLRGAVERKDVPGVVALITDRQRVLYQGAFGVADVSTGRPLTADSHVPHRLDDQADHVARTDAARRAGPHRARRPGREISAGAWRSCR